MDGIFTMKSQPWSSILCSVTKKPPPLGGIFPTKPDAVETSAASARPAITMSIDPTKASFSKGICSTDSVAPGCLCPSAVRTLWFPKHPGGVVMTTGLLLLVSSRTKFDEQPKKQIFRHSLRIEHGLNVILKYAVKIVTEMESRHDWVGMHCSQVQQMCDIWGTTVLHLFRVMAHDEAQASLVHICKCLRTSCSKYWRNLCWTAEWCTLYWWVANEGEIGLSMTGSSQPQASRLCMASSPTSAPSIMVLLQQ